MSVSYAMQTGGNVTLKSSYIIAKRQLLDDGLRKQIRRRLRENIIRDLEEMAGLPFDLAITNITSWKEYEETYMEWENFKYARNEQPVEMLTTCYVRGVEYPALLDSNIANT